jgi:hypothetical protein
MSAEDKNDETLVTQDDDVEGHRLSQSADPDFASRAPSAREVRAAKDSEDVEGHIVRRGADPDFAAHDLLAMRAKSDDDVVEGHIKN